MEFEEMSREQAAELAALYKAIDDAPYAPPCENFPDAFFPAGHNSEENRLAKELCRVCPVLAECGAYGIRWPEFGIWGGMGESERKQLRNASNRSSRAKRRAA